MSAFAILLSAALASGITDAPHKSPPPPRFCTLMEMFDAERQPWTDFLITSTVPDDPVDVEETDDSLFTPLVRETLESPRHRMQLSGFVFGGVRVTR